MRALLVSVRVALVVLAFGANPCLAQEAPAASRAKYKELIKHALEEYDLGNWAEARVYFNDAHTLWPNARTLRGLGMTCYEARDYVQAIGYLQDSLANRVQPLTPALADETKKLLERARSFVTTLTVRTEPEDADLVVDDQAISSNAHGKVLLNPGQHEIHASKSGYPIASRVITAEGGGPMSVILTLRRPGPQPADDALDEAPPPPLPAPKAAQPAAAQEEEAPSQQNPVAAAILAPLGVVGLATGWVLYAARQKLRTIISNDITLAQNNAFHLRGIFALSSAGAGAALFSLSEYFWLPDDPGIPALAWVMGGAGVAVLGVGIAIAVAVPGCPIGDMRERCQGFTADIDFGPLLALHALPLLTVPLNYAIRQWVGSDDTEVDVESDGHTTALIVRGAF